MTEQLQRTWWSRHWKWAVSVSVVGSVLVFGGCLLGMFALVFGVIRSSTPYIDSLAAVRASQSAQQELGLPIEPALFVTGNISTTNNDGHADLSYAVTGPDGAGTVYVVGVKTAGDWEFTTMELRLDKNGERIDLLADK